MKKAFIILNGILFLFLISTMKGQNVNVTMDIPRSVNAGSDFEVKLSINKGILSDYSRFSQELPFGLTATNVSSPNADFSFEEQRVRIIWLKLPEDNVINVVYKIHVDKRLKGSFTLEGNFAYVVNEERKYANMPRSASIFITPDPTVNQSMLVDINDFEKVISGAAVPVPGNKSYAMAIRQKPIQMSGGSVFVQLLVKNPEGSKYAKIEETIPAGYIFEEAESHRAIVSFGSSQVKYIWMKLPEEKEFMISYKLIPKSGERQEAMKITGILSYSIADVGYEEPVIEVEANLADLSDVQRRDLLQTGKLPGGSQAQVAVTPAGTGTTTQQTTPKDEKVIPTGTPAETKLIMGTKVLTAERGVYYRIQLIALRQPFDGALHFSRLGINREIRVEQQGGLYKYSTGSFSSYLDASSYKKTVISKPGLEDAFIIAYRNGTRISIEEAIRDSN